MTHHGRLQGAGAGLVMATLSACARGRHETALLAAPNGTGQPSGSAAMGPAETDRQHPAFHERDDERQELARILAEEGIKDPVVLRALRTVPRHAFVTSALQASAYSDQPLPIIGGQTISQPYVVAFMTEAAKPTAGSVCLEIGTGSGYQAAILAEFCKRTYSIEYLPEVARFGEKHLRELGYGPERVLLRVGDGYGGWPDAAPFDVILVTAAPERVPAPLLEQLAVGGRLVIPVGASDGVQELERWTRRRPGQDAAAFRIETLLPVRFVPFAGERAKARPD